MIYVDATSRAHFQRSFPKLSNFIKNFMTYDENLPEKKIEAYQFMKYHSFAPSTPQNILPMFYGNSMKSNKGIHSIKYFKQNGFVTGHEVDMCNKEQYDISHDGQSDIENMKNGIMKTLLIYVMGIILKMIILIQGTEVLLA